MPITVPVFNLRGEKSGEATLPPVFSTPVRPDVISRAYWIVATHRLQPKGASPLAGMKASVESFGVGRGMSRVSRAKGERFPRAGQAAGIAGVVKGRPTHPPRPEKRIHKLLNRKERRLATASALAASAVKELVALRGHKVSSLESAPIVISDELENIDKTSEFKKVFEALGLREELERCERGRKRCSGTAARRGRVTRVPRGPLVVTAQNAGVVKAIPNIPGVEHTLAKDVSVLDLAPGGSPGRLLVMTESAVKALPEALNRIGEAAIALRQPPRAKPRRRVKKSG